MKIVLAPDSFKGALSAPAVCAALARGLRRVWPDAQVVAAPAADGGEGTAQALAAASDGRMVPATVSGPLGEPVAARWALLGDSATAAVELAEASGLTRIPTERRNPETTSTLGFGQLIAEAAAHPGVTRLLLTLGGSATNDGGAGALQALGAHLTDAAGAPLSPGGVALATLSDAQRPTLPALDVQIACDVDNPLVGPRGASAVFGPQKGATPAQVARLDAALAHFQAILGAPDFPGAGAAGGAAYGLKWLFPDAAIRPGIEIVLDAIRFDDLLAGADLVLTGEGRLDTQTLGGKVVAGVARRARAAGVPVAAIVGGLDPALSGAALADAGIDAVLPLAPGPCALDESMAHADAWLADAAERAARWIALGRKCDRRRGILP